VDLDPPLPVSAVWFGFPPNTIIVTFNHPLNAGALNAANWTARRTLWNYHAVAALAAGNTVTLTMVQDAPSGGADQVNYAPPPFDVTAGPRRVPAAAFAGYPLT